MKFPLSLLAGAVALASSQQLAAQAAAPEGADAQQDVLRLAPLIVETGIERDAVISEISADEISRRQVDDYEEVVRLLPGVSVSKGDERWGASGFNIRGLDEDRVAMNVDGVPQGETLRYETGQAYGYFKGSRNSVDVETLKAIEIVKGADSILSGSGSLAGAVNMTTKDPDDYLNAEGDDSAAELRTRYSSVNDQAMGSLSLANRSGSLESMLVYTRREGHEYENHDPDGLDVDGAFREIPDPQDLASDSVLAKVIYELRPGHSIGLTGNYTEQNRFTDSRSYNGGWYADRIGDDYSTTERYSLTHELVAATPLFDRISSSLNHQQVDFEANTTQAVYIVIGGRLTTDEDRTDTRSFNQELWQATVDLDKTLDIGNVQHNLTYGVEVQAKEFSNVQMRTSNSRLNTLGTVTRNIGALLPSAEADINILYALDTFQLGSDTELRVGARYDDYTYDAQADANFTDNTGTLGEISFNTSTWTLGLSQLLGETLTLEAGISTGFRAPTVEDMYSVSGTAADWNTIPNPNLKAEYSTNYDVALSGRLANAGTWRAGVFQSDYDDFIDYQTVEGINPGTGQPDPNGYNVAFNSNGVTMRGVELAAAVDLSLLLGMDGWSSSMQAAWTDGENANGDPVYSVQPFSMTWAVDYNRGAFGASLYARHISGKENGDAYSTDDAGVRTYPLYLSNTATVLDLVASYAIGAHAEVSLAVNNLTDKEYYLWDSVRFVDQGDLRPGIGVEGNGVRRYSEPGRNFEAAFSLRF